MSTGFNFPLSKMPPGMPEYDEGNVRFRPACVLNKPRTRIPLGYVDQAMRYAGLEDAPFIDDPASWIEFRIGEYAWSKQREILQSIVDHRYTAVQSCHDTGKSYSMSRAASWWLDVHPPGTAFVVTTAPTYKQVQAILWREIEKARAKAEAKGNPLPGRTTLDCQWFIGRELVAYGRKPADYNQSAFQGIHAPFVLVIIDEACGVNRSIFDAVDSLATNEHARVCAIGNPDDPTSYFATVCKPGSGWNRIKIGYEDTPAFTGEAVTQEVLDSLISRVWVEERERRWGKESPVYISKVLGEFPDDAEDAVVPGSWAFRCADAPNESDILVPNEAGVDCGAGGDESVMVQRLGNKALPVFSDRVADTMSTASGCTKAVG